MGLNVFHNLIHTAVQFLVGETHQPLAEAVAAVHGALVSREEQNGLGVFVLDALQFGVVRLAAGVKGSAGVKFVRRGDAHPPDRIMGIGFIHKGQVIGSNQ